MTCSKNYLTSDYSTFLKKMNLRKISLHGQIMKRGRGKILFTDMQLQIIHSAQLATANFYGSRSLQSRRQLCEE